MKQPYPDELLLLLREIKTLATRSHVVDGRALDDRTALACIHGKAERMEVLMELLIERGRLLEKGNGK